MKQRIWIDPKNFKNVQVVLIDRETFHRISAEEKYSDIFQTVLPGLFLKEFQYKDFSAQNIYFTPSYFHGLFQL